MTHRFSSLTNFLHSPSVHIRPAHWGTPSLELELENKQQLYMYCKSVLWMHRSIKFNIIEATPSTWHPDQNMNYLMGYVVLWNKKIPHEDQTNSSETRLYQVSDEIIRVRGWYSLVPQKYIMMAPFSRPLCDF